jgi:PKD repeat protein
MAQPSPVRPTTLRLLSWFLVLAVVLLSPAGAWATKGCAESLIGQSLQPPASLWGDLEPESVLLDATNWTGSQAPTTRFPITTSIDIENGWIFHSFYGGIAIWDAHTDPAKPVRVSQLGGFEGQIPGWRPTGEFTQVIQYVDAPEGVDTIMVVGGLPSLGLTIWDTSIKTSPRELYQDKDRFSYQVYAARIGGRDYAFAGDFQGNTPGVHVYDMTAARSYTSGACSENTTGGDNHCNVYRGRIGGAEANKYVNGLQVGNRHFLVTSGGDSTGGGIKIWDVTNPLAAALVVQGFQGFGANGATHGVAMWTHNGSHYLAARQTKGSQDTARIFNITSCLTNGCSNLPNLQIWQSPTSLKPYPESIYWLSTTFSRSGSVPFIYFGNHDVCRQNEAPLQTEYLYDVSNPAQPVEITPDGTTQHEGKTVDYWSWYYSDWERGFAHMGPRMAKFNGQYLYRAGATIFDVHEFRGATGPPVANFFWSPDPVFAGDPITFTSNSSGAPTSFQWTFQDGSPASSAGNSAQVTFTSPGAKSVGLTATNPSGQDVETKNVIVLNPAPGLTGITPSPANPLVCQPVTLTADNVTGKQPLTVTWEVNQVQAGSGNPFTWPHAPGRTAGSYTVTARVSKPGFSDATSSTTVTLAPLPALPAQGSFAPTNDGFPAGTVQFHVNAAGATEWKWDFGDGTVTPWITDPVNGPNPKHSYTATGNYNVTVRVKNCAEGGENGVLSGNLPVTISQVAPLKVNRFVAQGCQVFCDFSPNQQITFGIEVEGQPTQYEYDWLGNGFGGANGADDQLSNTLVTTHSYPAEGSFTPALRLRRGPEISDPVVHPLTISIRNGAGGGNNGGGNNGGGNNPSSSVSGPTSGQVGQSYSYTVSSDNCTAGTWTWSATPDGSVSPNGASATVTWPTGGTKTVRANSGGNCPAATRTVNISNPATGGMTAQFTFTPPNPLVGQAVTFDGSSSTGNPVVFFWEFGDGQTAFGPTVTHSFGAGSSFSVKLTVSKDCSAGVCASQASTTRPVTVVGTPPVTASFNTSATCTTDLVGERCDARAGEAVTFSWNGTGATSFTWNFGDGTTGSGAQVTHSWTEPGTFLVQLTVGDGKASASASRVFVVTGEAVAQTKSVVLPWIAQTRGALVQSSDLYIHNPTSTAIDVKIQFRRRGVPESTPPEALRKIEPGATLFVGDILGELFDRENIAGFVHVVVENGTAEPVINSFNTTFQTDGSQFGQTIPGIALSRTTSAAGSGPSSRMQHLVGLSDNGDRLAYFGLSNPSEQTVSYRLRFFNKLGQQIGQPVGLALGGFSQKQFQVKEIREQFGITDIEDYRVEIETTSAGRLFPYGANLRRASEDPSFVGAGSSDSSKVYLVGALSQPGLNNSIWQSDIVLSNTGSEVALTDMWFTPVGANSNPTQKVALTLQPGETERLVNVIADKWGITDAAGVLTLDSDAPQNVFPVIQGESYDNAKPAKKFGQTIPAFTDADAAGPGKSHYLVGLRQDAKHRTTYWLFNPGTTTAEYEIVYLGLDGKPLGNKINVALGAGKARQMSPGQHPLPKDGVKDGFTVRINVKSGKVLSAGQVVNNATNDPAYVKGELR